MHNEFIKYLTFEKRYSPHTIKAYKTDIESFMLHIGASESEGVLLIHATKSEVKSWMVELSNQKTSARSINRKLSSLRSMYKYFQLNGKVDNNPVALIKSPKNSTKLPVFVEEDKLNNLLDGVYFEGDALPERSQLIITLFYTTGIRQAELIHLKLSDFDVHSLQIKVLGKGNKERIIPILKNVADLYRSYLKVRPANGNNLSDNLVFLTNKGKKLYPKFVYRVVNNYLSRVTTVSKLSPHVLRHSFATHMLNRGADINAIKELLGHTSLAATQVYTHNNIEQLKNIHKQAHPKG